MGALEKIRNELSEKPHEPFCKDQDIDYWGARDCVLRYARRAPLITLPLMARFSDVSNERMEESLQNSAYGSEGGEIVLFLTR